MKPIIISLLADEETGHGEAEPLYVYQHRQILQTRLRAKSKLAE